nr:hypothetical protein [Tanacetum cinerariifolium]
MHIKWRDGYGRGGDVVVMMVAWRLGGKRGDGGGVFVGGVTMRVMLGVRRRLEVKADSGGDVGVVEGIDPVDLRWNIAMMAAAATAGIRPKKMGRQKS